jgi:hypothetical protein
MGMQNRLQPLLWADRACLLEGLRLSRESPMSTKVPDGTIEALATGEVRFEELPREWQAILNGESDTSESTTVVVDSDIPPPLKLTKDRQRILAEVEWVNSQPWAGTGGAYNRLGYLAFLGVAWRVNRLFDLGMSVREFGERIGTKSIATAHRVLWRILNLGLVRKREEEPSDEVRTTSYRYDLQQLRSRNNHSLTHPCLKEIQSRNVPPLLEM